MPGLRPHRTFEPVDAARTIRPRWTSKERADVDESIAVNGADGVDARTEAGDAEQTRIGRMRRWSVAALVAHVAFTFSWILAAAWQGPRYSLSSHTISDMYANGAPGAWFLILVITLSGAALLLFVGRSLWPALREGGRAAAIGATLLALSIFGLGDLLSPFEREGCRMADAGCTSSAQVANAGGALDATLSTVGVLALIAAGFFLASAMKRVAGWQSRVRPVRRASAVMIGLLVLDGIAQPLGVSGLAERFIALAGAAAIVALATGVLRRTR
jgi:hypothetical protein